jgi:uncharacterized membrane protein
MFFWTYRGVVAVLVLFVVYASLLGWPDSRFAFWVHRAEPVLWVLGVVVAIAAIRFTLRKH